MITPREMMDIVIRHHIQEMRLIAIVVVEIKSIRDPIILLKIC
jgi:hypothetical protein